MVVRSWKRNWIVFTATIVHFVWGLVLLFDPSPLHTTPMGLIHSIDGISREVWAFVYMGAAVAAVVPFVVPSWDTKLRGLALSLPQQFLLMVSCGTAIWAVLSGRYPDGYVPDSYGSPHLFIFVDQLWPTVGMILHTTSLWDWYWGTRYVTLMGTKVPIETLIATSDELKKRAE